ncbi:MAG: ATP-binding protein [Candidatus Binataceae bacterium]|jgi:NtrC-family two-component system sensor histidine kinase KinB
MSNEQPASVQPASVASKQSQAPPLRSKIRNGTLIMLALAIALGALALPGIYKLSGAIRETLHRNYISIEAARQMHTALYALQIAQRDGKLATALPANRDNFLYWDGIEQGDITEVGEAELARDIDQRGRKLIAELPATGSPPPREEEFAALHDRLDKLIQINSDAMFRADSRASRIGWRLTYEFGAGLAILLVFGIALSWTIAWSIAKPLGELAERLRSFSLRGPSSRLGEQPLAELEAVAFEFNKMAERLEQFDKLNVGRIIYEKEKTEAIVESLEDGIVLLDPDGVVAHINDLAAIILQVEREDALGSRFDDLSSNHQHYLRVRSALRAARRSGPLAHQIEVSLHVRGREHSYMLKPVPLRRADGQSFGTILILQDITYLRDKDRARTNLVATLSHELKTPLTSIAMAGELLERRQDNLDSRQRELVEVIGEETQRIRHLADGLLDLARGETTAIAVSNVPLDFVQLIAAVVENFAMQVEQKQIKLATHTSEPSFECRGDPVKLSWVLSNLISNALRYTPSGGAIDISAERLDHQLRLTVADTGSGIAPEIRERIFERFTQYGSKAFESGSAGLGLAIAKDIVEAHGGRIFVDSSDRGSKFTVEIPIAGHA